jgi:hypothetical protein
MLAISVLGCSTFNSLQGEQPLAVASEYGLQNRRVMVIVRNDNRRMYCSGPDAADDIVCDVGYGDLEKNIHGNWEFLSPQNARDICRDAMWTVPVANQHDVQACAYVLLRIRFTKLVPVPPDPNQ